MAGVLSDMAQRVQDLLPGMGGFLIPENLHDSKDGGF